MVFYLPRYEEMMLVTEKVWTYLCVFVPDVLVCRMSGCEHTKWIIFTYHSLLVRKVTNLFKNTDIKIAFKANNTIYQQLAQKADNRNPSGIYEIKCITWSKNYVGQSGRHITTRHKEHIRYIKTNNPASAYATHILNNRHEYETANDTLKLIQPC
jgi:hypothetical protein